MWWQAFPLYLFFSVIDCCSLVAYNSGGISLYDFIGWMLFNLIFSIIILCFALLACIWLPQIPIISIFWLTCTFNHTILKRCLSCYYLVLPKSLLLLVILRYYLIWQINFKFFLLFLLKNTVAKLLLFQEFTCSSLLWNHILFT